MEVEQAGHCEAETDTKLFAVRTLGLRRAEADVVAVAEDLARTFQVSPKKARRIVAERVLVAKEVPYDKARRLKKALLRVGVHARIENLSDRPKKSPEPSIESTDLDAFLASLHRSSLNVERSATYKLWAIAAASAAVVAPTLYLMILGVVVAGCWLVIEHAPVPTQFYSLALYATPLIVGLTLLIFLVRPLFTRYSDPPRMELTRATAPALHDLVRRISLSTDTPEPQTIYVDNHVNASVAPAGGIYSLTRRKLELTVGMPLLYALNARELASVIAHEFGHFAQPVEMFSNALVNTVNGWMATCAWYRDPFEDKLRGALNIDWFITIPAQCALWSITGVRHLMRGLLVLSTRITRRLSQQMEFNADDHAVHVVGSKAFIDSSCSIRELMQASEIAWQANYSGYQENRLMEDLPAAIRKVRSEFTPTKRNVIRQGINEEVTEYWHTHPADRERIERADAQDVSDIEHGEFESKVFVKNPEKLARQLTLQTYTREHLFARAADEVTDNAVVFEIHDQHDGAAEAVQQLFPAWRCCRFPQLDDAPDVLNQHVDQDASKEMTAHSRIAEERGTLQEQAETLFLAIVYADAKIQLEPGTLGIESHDPRTLDAELSACERQLAKSETQLRAIDTIYLHRIQHAHSRMNEESRHRCDELLRWLQLMAGQQDALTSLNRFSSVVSALINVLSDFENKELEAKLIQYRTHCLNELNRFLRKVETAANPLRSAETGESMGAFLKSWEVHRYDDADQIAPSHALEVSTNCLNAIWFLTGRAVAEVAQLTSATKS